MTIATRELLNSIGLLILRLGVGGYMLAHGWGKVQMVLAGNFEAFADPLGLGKTLSLILVTGAEFGCALLVMIGFLTRLAAIPVVIAMAVAAFLVHANDPWTMGQGPMSKEPALLFLIPFLTLVFTGAGRFSLDGVIWRQPPGAQPAAPPTA